MHKIDIFTTNQHAEILADQLSLLEAVSITWQDAKNSPIYEPDPGEFVLWPEVILSAYFSEDKSLKIATLFLTAQKCQKTLERFNLHKVPETDWVRESLDQFKPQLFGERLWIHPSWEAPVSNAIAIELDPGLAFGTGAHATTRLCLEWLITAIKGGERIIDYGAGSGILGLAALKLGAQYVYFIDHDPQALLAVKENLNRNHIDPITYQVSAALGPILPISLIIANILAKPLIKLAPQFEACLAPGGQIALSGLLPEQCDEVSKAYNQCDFLSPITLNNWSLLVGCKK